MKWHPLTLAVWLAQGAAWMVFLPALWRIVTILPRWDAARYDGPQLRRERLLDLAVFQGCWTLALQTFALVLVVAGISNVWVPVVPGAMCGTGVLQAMGPAGRQALVLETVALLILYCWLVVERLRRAGAGDISAIVPSRMLLLAAPVMAVATLRLVQAVAAAAPHAPVSCCVALYDRIGAASREAAATGSLLHATTWMLSAGVGALCLAAWGWVNHRSARLPRRAMVVLASLLMLPWLIAVYNALTLGVAPYIYEILYHPCPWCLFLVDHGVAGGALFGLPAWITVESAAGLAAFVVARRYPRSLPHALRRFQLAGARVGLAALVLLLFAAWPIISWRIRSGAWMH